MTVGRALVLGVPVAIATALAVVGVSSGSPAERCGDHPWCDTALGPDARAGLLLQSLTRREKIDLLAGDDPEFRRRHSATVDGVPRLGVPAVFYTDGPVGPVKGPATEMPAPLGLAAGFDARLARRAGAVVAREARAKGNHVVHAPAADIMRTPLGGRTYESYGEDPFLAGSMASAWVRAAQRERVIANVKHFGANNQEGRRVASKQLKIVGGRLSVNAVVDERALREIYLAPYEAAVRRGRAGAVMCAFNRLNGPFACHSRWLLDRVLRRDWGFRGYVLADYGAAKPTLVGSGLRAGLDLDPWPGYKAYAPAAIEKALADGEAGMADVDEHVRRVLRTLFARGVFDRPSPRYDDSRIDFRGHAGEARAVAEQAATLLKNDGVLPLDPAEVGSIALIGAAAGEHARGGGSSQVTPKSVVSPRAGIERRAGGGIEVRFDPGEDLGRAAALARGADVAVVVAADASTEGFDKRCPALDCSGDQDRLIAAVAAANPRTVVVLETGAPVLTPWRGAVAAILEAWYPGSAGGAAIARVLFGDADPGGRLPVTFPARESQLSTTGDPEAYPGVNETVRYKEGVLVGYRWFDAKRMEPAFPFGFGLSYTRFRFSDLRVRGRSVEVTVTNAGRRRGVAVPQLYVEIPARPGLAQPPRQLKGFAKVRLAPGRSARVRFPLAARTFSWWDPRRDRWTVAPGCHRVLVGSSSRDLPLRACADPPASS